VKLSRRQALVERPVACAGKGQYYALVYYGSPGGDLHHHVFEYGRRDPRNNDEAEVLRNIIRVIPSRYRDYIIAISVIKRCLHPKSADVARKDRKPHFERVFSWVFKHDQTVEQSPGQTLSHSLHSQDSGKIFRTVALPYTKRELHELPVKHIVSTEYWNDTHAAVGMRGVERVVTLNDLN
jgi:hypothetical protein